MTKQQKIRNPMTYKVRMTAPKSAIEGWQGRVSVDGGATWIRLTKYVGGGICAFDSEAQLMKEAAKVARRLTRAA